MRKILITGANGQLGNELRKLSIDNANFDFLFTDIDELDITNNKAIQTYFNKNKPDILINTAAYTAVDLAETELEKAYNINANAVSNLANCCAKTNTFFIHISTDFVFDGKRSTPYHENISTNPYGVYAQSKNKGEIEILISRCNAAIIRTSWLYGNFGKNFMKTMLQLGKNGKPFSVVFDQIGTPTYSADLAEIILKIAENSNKINEVQLFHYSNEGVASWYDFAYEILNIADIKTHISPIETIDFPRPAPRPAYSVLNKTKIKDFLKIEIPHWKYSLKKCLEVELKK